MIEFDDQKSHDEWATTLEGIFASAGTFNSACSATCKILSAMSARTAVNFQTLQELVLKRLKGLLLPHSIRFERAD